MGLGGLWFWGKPEEEKKKVLVEEAARLYKTTPEIILKGFEVIEKEVNVQVKD